MATKERPNIIITVGNTTSDYYVPVKTAKAIKKLLDSAVESDASDWTSAERRTE